MTIDLLLSIKRRDRLLSFDHVEIERITFTWTGATTRLVKSAVFGVDPGITNLGFAFISPRGGELYQCTLPSKQGAVDRIRDVRGLTTYLIALNPIPAFSCVEYAAHGAPYRQTALAESRAAALAALTDARAHPQTAAPLSIRKVVFGNGKIRAEETWPELPKDAASALACALYPLMVGVTQ